jgi:hypothetical protein
MNTYTQITIEDKKGLILERIKNNENALYHLSISLIESNTNGATQEEVTQVNEGISRATANVIALNEILNDLNNGIDEFNQY